VYIVEFNEEISFEQELVQDMIELIQVFSSRLYGARSHKDKRFALIAHSVANLIVTNFTNNWVNRQFLLVKTQIHID